jgi:hypothetical protein
MTLVEPLLTEKGRAHPTWKSWLAHCAVVTKSLQHVYVDSEADELAVLIEAHEKAFGEVKEYKGLDRPKHHFLTHLPRALRNWGPFRGFWCMPFEGFLQVSTPHLEHTLPFSRSSISHTLSLLPSSPLLLLCS